MRHKRKREMPVSLLFLYVLVTSEGNHILRALWLTGLSISSERQQTTPPGH